MNEPRSGRHHGEATLRLTPVLKCHGIHGTTLKRVVGVHRSNSVFFSGFCGQNLVVLMLLSFVVSRAEAAQRIVALTFDDVPGHPTG